MVGSSQEEDRGQGGRGGACHYGPTARPAMQQERALHMYVDTYVSGNDVRRSATEGGWETRF